MPHRRVPRFPLALLLSGFLIACQPSSGPNVATPSPVSTVQPTPAQTVALDCDKDLYVYQAKTAVYNLSVLQAFYRGSASDLEAMTAVVGSDAQNGPTPKPTPVPCTPSNETFCGYVDGYGTVQKRYDRKWIVDNGDDTLTTWWERGFLGGETSAAQVAKLTFYKKAPSQPTRFELESRYSTDVGDPLVMRRVSTWPNGPNFPSTDLSLTGGSYVVQAYGVRLDVQLGSWYNGELTGTGRIRHEGSFVPTISRGYAPNRTETMGYDLEWVIKPTGDTLKLRDAEHDLDVVGAETAAGTRTYRLKVSKDKQEQCEVTTNASP